MTGKTQEDHCQNLETVLTRLSQAELWLKSSKCTFFKPGVEYLGHRIDKRGLAVPQRPQGASDSGRPRPAERGGTAFLPGPNQLLWPFPAWVSDNIVGSLQTIAEGIAVLVEGGAMEGIPAC